MCGVKEENNVRKLFAWTRLLALALPVSIILIAPHSIGLMPVSAADTTTPPVPGNCAASTMSTALPADTRPPNLQANVHCRIPARQMLRRA